MIFLTKTKQNRTIENQTWYINNITLVLIEAERLRQESHVSQGSLGHTAKLSFKTT